MPPKKKAPPAGQQTLFQFIKKTPTRAQPTDDDDFQHSSSKAAKKQFSDDEDKVVVVSRHFGKPKDKDPEQDRKLKEFGFSDSDEDGPSEPKKRPADKKPSPAKAPAKKAKAEVPKVAIDPTSFFGAGKVHMEKKAKVNIPISLDSDDDEPLSSAAPAKAKSPAKATPPAAKAKSPAKEASPATKAKSPAKAKMTITPAAEAVTQGKTATKRRDADDDDYQPKNKSPAKKTAKADEGEADGDDAKPKTEGRKGFWAMKNREAPKALGTRAIPEAAPNCMGGMAFVMTGEFETIARDQVTDIIKRYGGRLTGSVSGKTTYLLIGRDAGETKQAKAKQLGTKTMDEDQFYAFLESASPVAEPDYADPDATSKSKSAKRKPDEPPQEGALKRPKPPTPAAALSAKPDIHQSRARNKAGPAASDVLWVDKYKPQSLKEVCGNRAQIDRLMEWLREWEDRHVKGIAAKPKAKAGWGKKDDSHHKAVLISGPPGIGKTTAATLAARECGYDPIEFNASDTRSVGSLRNVVAELLDNRSIKEYFGGSGNKEGPQKNHLLIMDEVDGMSAGDRGGMAELVKLIKTTKVPIICICNDYSSKKVRTLTNYCHDLRFHRPNVNQIRGKMMSVAFKEGLKIQPNALDELISASQNDIRQILNQLSIWRVSDASLTYDDVKAKLKNARKDTNGSLGPFEVVRQIYTYHEHDKMSMDERLRLFYVDDLVPMMMQENYLNVDPALASKGGLPPQVRTLELISAAADSFSQGDIIDKVKRSQNAWGLMPSHGMATFVRPAYLMRGAIRGGQLGFPQWLGNYSKTSRVDRCLKELQVHMRTHGYSDTSEINQWYLPVFRNVLTRPMIKKGQDGIDDVIGSMDAYTLTREDWDIVMELSQYKGRPEIEKQIDSKVKTAFTRTYNKEAHVMPFAEKAALPKRSAAPKLEQGGVDDESGQMVEDVLLSEEELEADDMGADKMIKKAKASAKGKGGGGAASKGKGRK